MVSTEGLGSHASSADSTQTLSSVNETKSECLHSNGTDSHEDSQTDHQDSNGCKLTDTFNTDTNGSLKRHLDCQSLDRPTKKCRTESDSLVLVETDPSRAKED